MPGSPSLGSGPTLANKSEVIDFIAVLVEEHAIRPTTNTSLVDIVVRQFGSNHPHPRGWIARYIAAAKYARRKDLVKLFHNRERVAMVRVEAILRRYVSQSDDCELKVRHDDLATIVRSLKLHRRAKTAQILADSGTEIGQ